jgi:hypothetical protein
MSRQYFQDVLRDGWDTAPASLNTFTAEANLWAPNLLTAIPAFDMRAGKMYRAQFGGICQSATAINWTFTPRFGQSATPSSNLLLGASAVVPSGGVIPASSPWWGEFVLTVRSTNIAASLATVVGTGHVVWPTTAVLSGQAIPFGGTVVTTADPTTAQGFAFSVTCGTSSATNLIQALWCAWQSLN